MRPDQCKCDPIDYYECNYHWRIRHWWNVVNQVDHQYPQPSFKY